MPTLVTRKFLYVGVFLVAIGGVLIAADLTNPDATVLRDTLRLWPLAIVAIGVGVALRRTQFGLPAGLLAAAVPGLLLGGGFALAPRVIPDCGVGGPSSSVTTEQGRFEAPANVFVESGCGSLVVNTAPGNEWRFDRGDAEGLAPIIDASARSLSIQTAGQKWWHGLEDEADIWNLTLPTSAIDDLAFVVNAGQGRIALPGAQIGRLELTTNAGGTSVDLSGASVTTLAGTVNAGSLAYRLPADDITGSFVVNAGALELCIPPELGLRVRQDGDLGEISVNGQEQPDGDWQSPNFTSATHKAELTVQANLGSVDIDPIGGCK